MSQTDTTKPESIMIKIIKVNNCPLYQLDDEFHLSGRSLSLPLHKPACITLMEDIKEVGILCENLEEFFNNGNACQLFHCSGAATGCTGEISLEYRKERMTITESIKKYNDKEIDAITDLLTGFSIFQTLDKDNIKAFISSLNLKLKKFPKGDFIIKKGDPGINLFIILSGKVAVLGDDKISIAFLGKGEVFGEMSLLSGEPVGATIKVVEPVWVLFINGKDFRKVLNKFPSLQMYFARLLAKRLAQTNVARSEDFASAMTGKLSEMPPPELFQTLNQNQKTGVLTLDLVKGTAFVAFREGGLIIVKYGEDVGAKAFFEILKEKTGRFKFTPGLSPKEMEIAEIGDFMWLLMEGLNRMDDENGI